MTILKRLAVALVVTGIVLVFILYLHPTRSQQPAQPPKAHKITINWDKVPRAVSYNLYRRPYRIETYAKVATSDTSSYEDSAVKSGERYCYEITSVDSKGNESARSKEICLSVPLP
jgi:fibronectin type 3 domain-containing protein